MVAAFVSSFHPDDPLVGLELSERPEPEAAEGWATVTVKAASLNHHDIFSLRGVGLREEQLPMILGTDAAGIDEDGNEVIVHSVVSDPDWRGDETFDPKRTLLSEKHQGTMAERVVVPRANLVPKPTELAKPRATTSKAVEEVGAGYHVGADSHRDGVGRPEDSRSVPRSRSWMLAYDTDGW